jgi:divalent metal cation (Fe/Co/Zn/Cd) transporter
MERLQTKVLRSMPRPGASSLPSIDVSRQVVTLQRITIAWMCVECGVAIFSAWRAHSLALLAFGADSLVELLSALVVILQFTARFRIAPRRAARIAAVLLVVLAGVVTALSITALAARVEPQASIGGIAVTLAALVIMPALSRAKREAAHVTGDRALAADAVQSATCAYLAAITLLGLFINAAFHIWWIDPLAALAAVPILCIEAKRAARGSSCACC